VAIAVIGEKPYAEFLGDAQDLSLDRLDRVTLRNVQGLGVPVVTVVVSGRPIMVSNHLPQWKALVAAWLPGSQGEGVADVLFGDHDFQGRLPVRWPAHMGQYPSRDDAAEAPLFPYGFGLSYKGAAKN
jgi:beta-glucosidase